MISDVQIQTKQGQRIPTSVAAGVRLWISILLVAVAGVGSASAQDRAGDEILYPSDEFSKLDTFEGQAYIGIVPFRMTGVSLRGMPDVPWFSKFPELNVRTYVIGPDGTRGVWFFSLDATNPIAVRAARWL